MKLDKNINILIIGLGLIGGSYALSLKKQGYKVFAITKEKEDIEYAVKNGIIDGGSDKVDKGLIENADLMVFALYPKIFIEWAEKYGHLIKKGTIVTDVTGVKGFIVDKIQALMPKGVEFIAAHPMAGKEVYGVKNADDSIFKVANYIVVPTKNNTKKGIELCKALGETLGFAEISTLSVSEHDSMIAFLSQLTHCIAVSLMCANGNENLVKYTGDSFRDLTRIANINDEMWSELFLENKEALLKEMNSYKKAFDELYGYLENDDRESMRKMMKISTERRKKFNKKAD